MSDLFSVDFISASEHEHLAAEISFKGQILCRINKENGNEDLEIEFGPDSRLLKEEVIFRFPLRDFESVLRSVVEDLRTTT